jgi:gas vesicle protein
MYSIFRTKLTQLKNFWKSIFNFLRTFVSNTFRKIFTTVKSSITTITNWIKGTGKSLFKNAFGVIRDAIVAIFEGLDNSVMDTITELIDDVMGEIEDVIDEIQDKFDNLDVDVPDPDLPGGQDIMPGGPGDQYDDDDDDDDGGGGGGGGGGPAFGDSGESDRRADQVGGGGPVVGLATGGLVTEATNAIVGEGSENEAVLPLSKLSSYLDTAYASGAMAATPAPSREATSDRSSMDVRLHVEGDDKLAELIRENAELVVDEHEQERSDRLGRY